MRFLIDECCPRLFVKVLEDLGHDIRHVVDVMPGAADEDIMAFAAQDDRLIVTLDYDFGDIVVRSPSSITGVVLMGSEVPVAQHGPRLAQAVAAEGARLNGHLTLIGKARLRRRALP